MLSRAEMIRPATTSSRPSATICASSRATSGAIRWRWTSHHGRAWRRNCRCCSPSRPCHKCRLCGRRLSIAARQPTSALRRRSQRQSARKLPWGTSLNSTGAGSKSACERGIRPRRDSATIRPRWPAASSDSTRSTIVRPVPTSSAVSPSRGELRDRGMGVGAPRVTDEAVADAGERAQRFGLLIADSERQRVGVDPLAAIEHDLPAAVAARRAASAVASIGLVLPPATASSRISPR